MEGPYSFTLNKETVRVYSKKLTRETILRLAGYDPRTDLNAVVLIHTGDSSVELPMNTEVWINPPKFDYVTTLPASPKSDVEKPTPKPKKKSATSTPKKKTTKRSKK